MISRHGRLGQWESGVGLSKKGTVSVATLKQKCNIHDNITNKVNEANNSVVFSTLCLFLRRRRRKKMDQKSPKTPSVHHYWRAGTTPELNTLITSHIHMNACMNRRHRVAQPILSRKREEIWKIRRHFLRHQKSTYARIETYREDITFPCWLFKRYAHAAIQRHSGNCNKVCCIAYIRSFCRCIFKPRLQCFHSKFIYMLIPFTFYSQTNHAACELKWFNNKAAVRLT